MLGGSKKNIDQWVLSYKVTKGLPCRHLGGDSNGGGSENYSHGSDTNSVYYVLVTFISARRAFLPSS